MLQFSRNKVVSIVRKDADTLDVHGVLDDTIYALEVDLCVRISDMEFLSLDGKWNRWTTPECPKSLPFLQDAVGFRIEQGITQKLQKTVGRKACRHFATILTECCKSVREAVKIIRWEDAKKKNTKLSFEEFLRSGGGDTPETPQESSEDEQAEVSSEQVEAVAKVTAPPASEDNAARPVANTASGGFLIDLHTHTYPPSPCSSVSADEMIENAKQAGLNGICLTDHNYAWEADAVAKLSQKHGFLLLRGSEVTTDQGHMLVFGLDKAIGASGIVKIAELREEVEKADGFMIVAHPFRGFLTFGVSQLGLTVEKAAERPFFKYVDAVEVMNGKVTKKENDFASQVAAALGLPTTGGSDAHEASEVGIYATRFPDPIANEKELIAALKSGNYSPVAFRK
ncbi:MAG: hypothetical protein B6245_14515 [Desulfobacteraceae bacterium 4572_88]|nr:MAG: hypothetical protein B6245_14515 [Desulfobacteraceae bacterium 4572_88]